MIFWVGSGRFTLPETNIALENPPFSWYLPVNLGIFYGYVSLTEGTKSHVLGGFFRSYGGGQEFFFCFDSPPGPRKRGPEMIYVTVVSFVTRFYFFKLGGLTKT